MAGQQLGQDEQDDEHEWDDRREREQAALAASRNRDDCQCAAREAAELTEAEELARRIGKLKVVFTLETGETGKAFGSVTAQDLVKRLKNELGNEIDRHRIVLEHPLKTTGEHEVPIKLHHDVTAKFVFQIKPSKEEAPTAEPAGEVTEKARPFRKRTDSK